jgi:hypothetical protein
MLNVKTLLLSITLLALSITTSAQPTMTPQATEPLGTLHARFNPPPCWPEGSCTDVNYVPYCLSDTSTPAVTCGSLEVTSEVCIAFANDPQCNCTPTGDLSCTSGVYATASGCSNQDLTSVCASQFACACEEELSQHNGWK